MFHLHQIMTQFMIYLKTERNCSDLTLEAYGRDIKQLIAYLEGNHIPLLPDAVSHNLIRSFLSFINTDKELASNTISRKINCLRSFFNFCVEQDYIQVTPMRKIKAPKKQKILPVYLTKAELKRLLSTPDQYQNEEHWLRDKVMLYLFSYTGARRFELTNLKWSDLDFKKKTIKVFGKETLEKSQEILLPEVIKAKIEREPKYDRYGFPDMLRNITFTSIMQKTS